MIEVSARPSARAQSTPSKDRGPVLDWLVVGFVAVFCACVFAAPLRQHGSLLPYAQDDFYYYLIVARNILHHAGSTFDGVTPTNGYHPLYLLYLLLTTCFTQTLRGAYRSVWLLDMASALVTVAAFRAMLARHIEGRLLRNGLAVLILYLFIWRIFQQMEVTLTVPLAFLFLLSLDRSPQLLSARLWFGIGLLAALVTLSRLDAGLLVGLSILAALLQRSWRETLTPARIAAFLSGSIPPLALYFAINWHFFHRVLPISGTAKQLDPHHGFHLHTLKISLSLQGRVMFLAAILGLCLLPLLWKRLSPSLRVVCPAALLFPFLHWGINLYLSSWMLWPWYRYSLIVAIAALLLMAALLFEQYTPPRLQRPAGVLLLAISLIALSTARYQLDWIMLETADAARFVQAFAAAHPGRYAMGDRAGMTAYGMHDPVIQTEGLMMNDAFLDHIRHSDPLLPVLRQYNIDYYVAFDWRRPAPWPNLPCLHAIEPFQAGESAPHMSTTLCTPPKARLLQSGGQTLIYDLHDLPR